MKCFYIDLASHDGRIACVDDAVRCSMPVSHRLPDDQLVPVVKDALQEAGWQYSDITHIACVVGPGGFTSLRIAVTFANVLADQLGILSTGIHLSDLYRERSDHSDAYWMHPTKKDQLFVRGGQWEEPTLINLNDIPCGDWMGELLEEHQKASGAESITLKPLEDILPEFLPSLEYSREILHPWYGRGW